MLTNQILISLKNAPVDISKLSNVIKNKVVKKTVYDILITKGNTIDTSVDLNKYKYRDYGIGFDASGSFLLCDVRGKE